MPTPMPIMAAISGEKVGTTRTWVSSSSSAMPMPSPKSAVRIGRPMATTDPKASSMIRMAAVMPMPSLEPGAAVATDEIGLPPSATWNPGCGRRLRRVDDRLDGGGRDVGGVGVELDHGEGDVPVPARSGGRRRARTGWSRCGRGAAARAAPRRWSMAARFGA